jgi:hypothetical protein
MADTRFKPGNPGGPGRPRRAIEQQYLASMAAVVSIEDWEAITTRAVQDAKAGDNAARSWLAKHLIGDEPLALAELMEQVEALKAVIGEQRNGNGNGKSAAGSSGRGSATSEPQDAGPDVDHPGPRPYCDDDAGGNDAGQVAGQDPALF